MLKSFSIENFRTFQSFSINNFKRINFLTGKNNSGKTALLEAIFLHIGCMNPILSVNLGAFRGIPGTMPDALSLWSPLFNNYDIDSQIVLTGEFYDRKKSTLSISLVPSSLTDFQNFNIQPTAESTAESAIESPVHSIQSSQLSLLQERLLQYKYTYNNDELIRNTRITGAGFDTRPPVSPNPYHGFFIPSRYYLGPGGYATRFGQLIIKKMDFLVTDALRLLEPNIKSLSVIPIGPIPTIHVDVGASRLFPIQLTGEGMARIAEIAIDICSAKDGFVLVDDIDTGIHHSILPGFWKVINNISEKVNTQLFLTTHSSECIETAHTAFSNMKQYDMNVYRLQRTDIKIEVIAYDKNTLQAAIDNGLEVR